MASGRAHSPPKYRLLTPSDANDDRMFPLSINIDKASSINNTLPKHFAENINPPFDVARRLFYKNEHPEGGPNRLDDGRLMHSAGNGNLENAPRSFTTEETWKIPTWHDMNFIFGTNEVIPHGFIQKCPNPPNIFDDDDDDENDFTFDDDYVSIPERGALEETLFDKSANASQHASDCPTAEQTEARRFLESTQTTFVRFAGCTEEQINRHGITEHSLNSEKII